MAAPSSFQLSPAPEGLHLPPSPPRRLKPEIYQNVDVFKNVDEHAIAVSLASCFKIISVFMNFFRTKLFTCGVVVVCEQCNVCLALKLFYG